MEYLHDRAAAEATLDEAEEKLGEADHLLTEYRAKIYLLSDEYEAALDIYRPLFSEWSAWADGHRVYAYRDAFVSAAHLDDYGHGIY